MKVEKVSVCIHCGEIFDSPYKCIEHEKNCKFKNQLEISIKKITEKTEEKYSKL